jgi:hypothetical protein
MSQCLFMSSGAYKSLLNACCEHNTPGTIYRKAHTRSAVWGAIECSHISTCSKVAPPLPQRYYTQERWQISHLFRAHTKHDTMKMFIIFTPLHFESDFSPTPESGNCHSFSSNGHTKNVRPFVEQPGQKEFFIFSSTSQQSDCGLAGEEIKLIAYPSPFSFHHDLVLGLAQNRFKIEL